MTRQWRAVAMAAAMVNLGGGWAGATQIYWDHGAGTANLLDSNNYSTNGHPGSGDEAYFDNSHVTLSADYVPDVLYFAGTGKAASFSQTFGLITFDTPNVQETIYSTPDNVFGRVGLTGLAGNGYILSTGPDFGATYAQTLTIADGPSGGSTLIGLDNPTAGVTEGINVTNPMATIVIGSIIRNKLSDSSITHGIEKTGSGTLVLGGANIFGGAGMQVKITGGTLAISADNNLGNAGNLVQFNGGRLQLNPAANVSIAHAMNTGPGAVVDTPGSFVTSFAGILSGTGGLTKTGTGTLVLTKTNAFGGAGATVDIQAGTLTVATDVNLGAAGTTVSLDGGTLQSSATSTVTSTKPFAVTAAGGTIDLPSAAYKITGAVSGTGTLTKTGTGELQLDNAGGSFSGTVLVNGGNVRLFDPGSLGAATIQLNGSTTAFNTLNLRSDAAFAAYPVNLNVTKSGQLFVDIATAGQSGGQFTVGNITVGAVSLNLNGNSSGTTASIVTGNITLAGNATIQVSKTDVTVSGAIGETGGSETLKKTGLKAMYLTSPASFTGGLSIVGGAVSITNDNQIGAAGTSGLAPVTLNTDTGVTTPTTAVLQATAGYTTSRALVVGANGGNFDAGANVTIGAVSGAGVLTKVGTGALTVAGIQAGGLTVTNGSVAIAPGSTTGSSLGAYSYSSGTSLDVSDAKVAFTNGQTIVAALLAGRNGGSWNGDGIVSSVAHADSTGTEGIGYATAGDLGITSWGDVTGLVSSDIVTKLTYYGDINLDGQVDADDYALFDRAQAKHLAATWMTGDFNYDGVIDGSDSLLMDTAFVRHGGVLSAGDLAQREAEFGAAYVSSLAASVPEPGSGMMLLVGAAAGLRRVRRRK